MTDKNRCVMHFSLRLVTNTVVSQNSASSGDHRCLDFIPGAALLGVAAGKLYSQLAPEKSDLLFQSGRVRFTDALPAFEGRSGWPMPLCWHHIKGQSFTGTDGLGNRLDPSAIFDPSRFALKDGLQPKQLRSGYITTTGDLVDVQKDFELKTAINSETGGAEKSQLFGYQSLRAGQCFRFSVIADGNIDTELLSQLTEALSGPARIGRSRSAQFGEVVIEAISQVQPPQAQNDAKDNLLRLWLTSDLALMDERGNPLLTPTPSALGLSAESEWLADASFLRTRSYAPFNTKRRCYDLERQVISRGSVLVFRLPEPISQAQKDALQCLGQYQEAGLGQVVVNPVLLSSVNPAFEVVKNVKKDKPQQVATIKPDSTLVRFLGRRTQTADHSVEVEKYARKFISEIQGALVSAAAWAGLPDGSLPHEIPNRSQWGKVRELAVTYEGDPTTLQRQLFDSDHAVLRVREGQAAWRLQVGPKETLADRIRQATGEQAIPPGLLGKALAIACSRLMRDERLSHKEVTHESK